MGDYVGIEIQALDTTGTVWPSRQRFIRDAIGISVKNVPQSSKTYGMNWKMTAKTILIQLHHKATSLELFGKHLVLAIQAPFYSYMSNVFNTSVMQEADDKDAVHFHIYNLPQEADGGFTLELSSRYSTTTVGIETMLGMRKDVEVSEEQLVARIQAKLTPETLLRL